MLGFRGRILYLCCDKLTCDYCVHVFVDEFLSRLAYILFVHSRRTEQQGSIHPLAKTLTRDVHWNVTFEILYIINTVAYNAIITAVVIFILISLDPFAHTVWIPLLFSFDLLFRYVSPMMFFWFGAWIRMLFENFFSIVDAVECWRSRIFLESWDCSTRAFQELYHKQPVFVDRRERFPDKSNTSFPSL